MSHCLAILLNLIIDISWQKEYFVGLFWCLCINIIVLWLTVIRNDFVQWHRGWLERESRHGLQPSQNWFLISMQWWQQWKDYVRYVSMQYMYMQPLLKFIVQVHCTVPSKNIECNKPNYNWTTGKRVNWSDPFILHISGWTLFLADINRPKNGMMV